MPMPQAKPTLEELSASAREAATLLKALANSDRLMILCLIAEKERNVGELQLLLEMRQPTLSQQLSRLRAEGIVSTRRDGKSIYYSLNDSATGRVIELLYELYCAPGASKTAKAKASTQAA